MLKGTGVSPGIAYAKALHYIMQDIMIPLEGAHCVEQEHGKFEQALQAAIAENQILYEQAGQRAGTSEQGIFEAHIEIMEDEDSVVAPIIERINAGENAAQAVSNHFNELIDQMSQILDETLRERMNDFRDIKLQLLGNLLHITAVDLSCLQQDAIIIAHELTPADTVKMDLEHIKGFVCETGGATSHTAILARAMGIPAVVGCKDGLKYIENGDWLLLDGEAGEILPSPSKEEIQRFQKKWDEVEAEKQDLLRYRSKETISIDGRTVQIYANIASAEACKTAVENDCQGIGLFRSEFLFLDQPVLPDEETQVKAYQIALQGAGGCPLTIRTLDAGGDKNIPALGLPKEENPFLGYRAIRLCLDQTTLFKTQLRALYRASIFGDLRIMFPMISSMEELLLAKDTAAQVRAELDEQGIEYNHNVKIGMMVEVPSAAIIAEDLAQEVDFFSIGTNDLVQYTVAVDRGNEKVAHLYTHFHPAVIRLIHHTIQAAHQNGIDCCMCGEAAGDPAFIPLLLGLGLDTFSVAVPNILKVRRQIAHLSYEDCNSAAQNALQAKTVEQLEQIIAPIVKNM